MYHTLRSDRSRVLGGKPLLKICDHLLKQHFDPSHLIGLEGTQYMELQFKRAFPAREYIRRPCGVRVASNVRLFSGCVDRRTLCERDGLAARCTVLVVLRNLHGMEPDSSPCQARTSESVRSNIGSQL
jgi:hypothetical protein